jgi:hypothetical protein
MAEEPIAFLRAVKGPAARVQENKGPGHSTLPGHSTMQVRFDRAELNRILNIYGRMVAIGEWRDYAIDFLSDRAVFSAYRRTSEMPLYTIVKQPRLKARQGQYAVIAAGGHVLKRGHDLMQVLRVLERKLIKALSGPA